MYVRAMGVLLMTLVVSSPSFAAPQPAGAASCWTSNDPAVVEARGHVERGEFSAAEEGLKAAGTGGDPQAVRARQEMLETIRRMRREYTTTPEAMLKKVKASIPDATADDLERWREAGVLQHKRIDGRVMYFNREPVNLFRFSDEARRRRDEHQKVNASATPGAVNTAKLKQHIEQVMAEAERTGKVEVAPIRVKVRYELTVKPDRPGATAGSRVRCWLPYPQEYRQQKAPRLIRTWPEKHMVAPTAVDGESIGGAAQRTVYLEQRIEDPSRPVVFGEEFDFVSYAYYPRLDEAQARPLPAGRMAAYLQERPPHIVFTPEMKRLVGEVVGDEQNPLVRVRKIYHWCDEHIRYAAEEEYATIASFCRRAFDRRKGDCGVQSMLFITLCRIAGVPARWQSGWQTKSWNWNMHDWAEVYVEPWGWLPVDVSYGRQPSDDPKIRDFFIGHQDAYRLIVNLDYGTELHPPKESLRSEPADFQRGEVEIDGRNLYFDEWNYDVKFEWEAVKE